MYMFVCAILQRPGGDESDRLNWTGSSLHLGTHQSPAYQGQLCGLHKNHTDVLSFHSAYGRARLTASPILRWRICSMYARTTLCSH
jgi:hypothetical protein